MECQIKLNVLPLLPIISKTSGSNSFLYIIGQMKMTVIKQVIVGWLSALPFNIISNKQKTD